MARPIKAHELPDGRWYIRAKAGSRSVREYYATEEAANERIEQIVALRFARRATPKHRGDIQTLSDYFVDYVADQDDWSEGYRADVVGLFDKWVNPFLGGWELNSITFGATSDWKRWAIDRGATPSVMRKVAAVVGGCLTDAMRMRIYVAEAKNPFHGLPLPEYRAPKPPHSLDLYQILDIKKLLRLRASLVVSLFAFLGLRNGEVHVCRKNRDGLQWSDLVDVRQGSVRRTLIPRRTKSDEGDQEIEIWEFVRAEIESVWSACGSPSTGAVSVTARGRPFSCPDFHRYVWDPALVAAGFEVGEYDVHDLRDVTANMLGRARWSLGDAADYLGHSEKVHSDHYKSQFRDLRRRPELDPDGQLLEAAGIANYRGILAHEEERAASLELQRLYRRRLSSRERGVPLPSRADLVAELEGMRRAA